MRQVYFFQCQDFFDKSIYLPYASGCLWAYAATNTDIADNFELADLFFEKLPISQYLDRLHDPDVIFFSSYGWNTEYHLKLAEAIKQKFPHVLIVFGGPNVNQSRKWHEQHPYMDLSIFGEGEHAVQQVLLSRLKDNIYHHIPGVAQIHNGRWHQQSATARTYHYEQYPSPYLTGLFDKILRKYPYNFNVILETNRGCPYQCTFCDIGKTYFNKVARFSMDKVLAEIDWFSENQIEYVDISDSNFGILQRDVDIARYIRQKHDQNGWPKRVNSTWAKNNHETVFEMSRILEDVNRSGVTLALQSTNEVVLKNIKRKNVANTKLQQMVELYNQHNIMTYHDFVLGLPGETLTSWINGLLETVDLNPEAFIKGYFAQMYINTEFMEPAYIDQFGIQMRELPVGSFWVKSNMDPDIPVEKISYVTATADMPHEDFIEAFLFRVFLGTMHAQGWVRHTADHVSRHQAHPLSEFYRALWQWARKDHGFVGQALDRVHQELQDMFAGHGTWGRRIFGSDDVNWEYDSALSVEFESNRIQFFDDIRKFLYEQYPAIDIEHVVVYNDLQVKSFFATYPRQVGRWLVQCPDNKHTFKDFCVETYWHGRRMRRWRLPVIDLESLAPGQGIEPRQADLEAAVLP